MSSMVGKACKSVETMHSRGGYCELIIVTTPILNHKDGHYVRSNMVALKHHDFKKDADLNAHVKVFNYAIKTNVETSKEYIINVFNYMLKDMTSNWCHNYI
jgi:hypothetical protein